MRDSFGCDRRDGWIDRPGKKDRKLNKFLDGCENGCATPLDVIGGDGWMGNARKEGPKTEQGFGVL